MPIFRYYCKKCDQELELLLPRFDAEAFCPLCGTAELEKLNTTFAAVTHSAPASCAARGGCPSAGTHQCGGNCCCHGN